MMNTQEVVLSRLACPAVVHEANAAVFGEILCNLGIVLLYGIGMSTWSARNDPQIVLRLASTNPPNAHSKLLAGLCILAEVVLWDFHKGLLWFGIIGNYKVVINVLLATYLGE